MDDYNENEDTFNEKDLLEMTFFQFNELKNIILNKNFFEIEDWVFDTIEILNKIFDFYYLFIIYKVVMNELILIWIIDDNSILEGIDKEDIISLMDHPRKNEVFRELYDLKIIEYRDNKIFPGEILNKLLAIKKQMNENFASETWKKYQNTLFALIMIEVAENYASNALNSKNRMPQTLISVFNIISWVIYCQMKSHKLNENEVYKIKFSEINKIFRYSKFNRAKMKRFLGFLLGTYDGDAKLFEDIEESDSSDSDIREDNLIINRKLNNYIERIVERVRELRSREI